MSDNNIYYGGNNPNAKRAANPNPNPNPAPNHNSNPNPQQKPYVNIQKNPANPAGNPQNVNAAPQQNNYYQGGYQQNQNMGYQQNPNMGYQQANYQNNMYQQGGYQNVMNITEQMLPARFKPLSAWAYFGYSLLFNIPFVGFICIIVFAVSSDNINRRNFARSYLCIWVLAIVLLVISFIIIGALGLSLAGFADSWM